MMKLQPASQKEVSRIGIGCGVCAIIELIGLSVLSILGIGHFSYRMIIGAAGGTAVAVLNFAMMCMMVQNAAGIQDQKLLKAKVQASYNLRIFVQAAWVAVAFFVPFINLIAAAIPLLFPTVVIYYLQISGKLLPPSDSKSAAKEPLPEDTDPQDDLNTFEV